MTYLDYINNFWRKDREFFFTPEEVAIYFRLLDHANNIGWKEQFNLSLDRLMMEVGIKSRKPFDTARKTLREAGLLEFKNGNGRGCTTEYTLLPAETFHKRGVKNTPLSGILSGEVSGTNTEGLGKENGAVHKSKIKSKKKESNDSSSEGEKASSPAQPVVPAEPWAVWVVENTPTVQRLKKPLTGEHYAKLVADYGEAVVREVLQAMENKADLLKKYTSANLTARDWCKRRGPARPARPAISSQPSTTAGATASIVPQLNPSVVAERQAQRDAEAAENRRRVRESGRSAA